jgi:hypothetical protein
MSSGRLRRMRSSTSCSTFHRIANTEIVFMQRDLVKSRPHRTRRCSDGELLGIEMDIVAMRERGLS